MRQRRSLAAVVAGTVVLAGCASPGPTPAERAAAADATRDRLALREQLRDFSDRHAAAVMAATDRIKGKTADLEVMRRAVIWQLRSIQAMNEIVAQRNSFVALVDVVAFEARMRHIFEQGEFEQYDTLAGEGVLGPQTGIASRTARELENQAWALFEARSTPEDAAELRAIVDDWLVDTRDELLGRNRLEYLDQRIELGDTPGRPRGLLASVEGQLDQTTQTLDRLQGEVARLNQQAQFATTYARWTTEILLYEQFQKGPIAALGEDLGNTGDSLVVLAELIDRLPLDEIERLAARLGALDLETLTLDDLDLGDTIDARLGRVEGIVRETESLLDTLEAMGVSGALPSELNATLDRLGANEASLPEASAELGAQLDRAASLVGELRALTTDASALLNGVLGSEERIDARLVTLQAQLDASASRVGDESIRVLRAAAAYAAGVVLLAFVLMLTYRATGRRG